MFKFLIIAISGILTGLSFNYNGLSFFIWFSLIPCIYVLSFNKNSLKQNIGYGIIFTFSFYGTAIYWLSNVTSAGLIALILYFSIYQILFFIIGGSLYKKTLTFLTIPCLWVVLEFLKENIWCGFGWLNLGYSQYRNFSLIQIADLFGSKSISFLIIMVNVLAYEIGLWFLQGKIFEKAVLNSLLKKIILVLSCFIFCFLYSSYKMNIFSSLTETEGENFLDVSIVQPNISQEEKWDSIYADSIIEKLKDLGARGQKDSLIIYPEAAWPFIIDMDNIDKIKLVIESLNRNIIIGSVIKEKEKFYNTTLFFNQNGELIDCYRKIKLVPFGEYVPFRKYLSFIKVINTIGDMDQGNKYVSFLYKNKNFSSLICFEDVSPLHVRKVARKNHFLINSTNDAWFKGNPQASQHLAVMTFRAIENRISIVRSANTGISGWVSFKGEINEFIRKGENTFFVGVKDFKISLNKKRSLYNKIGEFFILACFIFLILFGFLGSFKKMFYLKRG
ncbi:MAG: apolipoprotein N-acyltransferase [Candidatus Omnitrophica bacterium]|nr:apolipoprotein N-acyltransferase [Candidatus Omnitrophota bacterium]